MFFLNFPKPEIARGKGEPGPTLRQKERSHPIKTAGFI
jgi:hypothetical protein